MIFEITPEIGFQMKNELCPLCGGNAAQLFVKPWGQYMKCQACELVFQKDMSNKIQ